MTAATALTTAPTDALTSAGSLPPRRPADPSDVDERLADYAVGQPARDLEHCLGHLLVHADGRVECIEDAACPGDPALHAGTEPCVVLADCCP